jgi:hypothetical protein
MRLPVRVHKFSYSISHSYSYPRNANGVDVDLACVRLNWCNHTNLFNKSCSSISPCRQQKNSIHLIRQYIISKSNSEYQSPNTPQRTTGETQALLYLSPPLTITRHTKPSPSYFTVPSSLPPVNLGIRSNHAEHVCVIRKHAALYKFGFKKKKNPNTV